MDVEQDNSFKSVLHKVIIAITLLWLIKTTELVMGWDFSGYSVFPRDFSGLTGLMFGPMLHSSFEHLFYNTSALLVLATALFYEYPRSAKQVFLLDMAMGRKDHCRVRGSIANRPVIKEVALRSSNDMVT